ncbi:MAG TPA: PadR family transcriptional regulator [Azospirillaceae bacterium]|nr:PadR family transcriptional regulator [Azospirillaceae bacterium]
MALRMAILGLLAEREMSGYDLMREFDRGNSLIWPAPRNEVYRELRRPLEAGLIARTALGARNRKSYAATGAGIAALRDWMGSAPDYGLSYEPMLRSVFLDLLPAAERRNRLAADRDFFAAQLAVLEAAGEEGPIPGRRPALHMVRGFYRAMLDWAEAELARTPPDAN